jgi:hypothetical protein
MKPFYEVKAVSLDSAIPQEMIRPVLDVDIAFRYIKRQPWLAEGRKLIV